MADIIREKELQQRDFSSHEYTNNLCCAKSEIRPGLADRGGGSNREMEKERIREFVRDTKKEKKSEQKDFFSHEYTNKFMLGEVRNSTRFTRSLRRL